MALLAGKTAVITGGARGLGSAITTAMATEGAHVVVVDRNGEAAAELVAAEDATAAGCSDFGVERAGTSTSTERAAQAAMPLLRRANGDRATAHPASGIGQWRPCKG